MTDDGAQWLTDAAVPVLPVVCTTCAALFTPVKGITICSLCQLALMKQLTFAPPPGSPLPGNPATHMRSGDLGAGRSGECHH